jgi:tRNA-splicing ligase RtcB
MDFGLEFARLNRDHMLDRAVLVLESNFKNFTLDGDIVNKHHNYAVAESHGGTEVMVHRKGAIKVEQGDLGIIPGSMDTGSYIVRGLGNEDSFNSASHGAGRRMSRGEAARSLDWDQVKKNLIKKDVLIYKGGVGNLIDSWPQPPYDKKTQRMMKDAISETAKGYKDIEEVLDWEADIVEPVVKLTPRATLKG